MSVEAKIYAVQPFNSPNGEVYATELARIDVGCVNHDRRIEGAVDLFWCDVDYEIEHNGRYTRKNPYGGSISKGDIYSVERYIEENLQYQAGWDMLYRIISGMTYDEKNRTELVIFLY